MKKGSPYSVGLDTDSWHELTDQELWNKFLRGDRRAYASMYEKYVDDLFSYGMKIRYNRSLVKDCIHDLFVDLWKHKASLSSTDNIRFYLYRALRRKIRYTVDREKSLFEEEPSYNFEKVQIALPFEHSLILQQGEEEKRKKIVAVLSGLPTRQQEVLRLIFFDELSYEEVSEIMSINVRSVYTLVWKALSALRKHLSEWLVAFAILLNY